MRRLHHFPLCPFSRTIRLILQEKKLEFTLVSEAISEKEEIFEIEPTGRLPMLVDFFPHSKDEEILVVTSSPIMEYLDEVYTDSKVLGESAIERAEARRLIGLTEYKIFSEVTEPFLQEKVLKRLRKKGAPNSMELRKAQQKLSYHFNSLSWLLSKRTCLSGENMNAADFTVAAHLSVLDYLSAIPWQRYATLQAWYSRIKSRPSFRSLLMDQVSGILPPEHYKSLDF